MKALTLVALTLFAHSAFASTLCAVRLSEKLEVALHLDNLTTPLTGKLRYDDANTCSRTETDEWICTQIYPGTFDVAFTVVDDEHSFRVGEVARTNDMDYPYNPDSALGQFAQEAYFLITGVPFSGLTLVWQDQVVAMDCTAIDDSGQP